MASTATSATIEVGGVGYRIELTRPHAASLVAGETAEVSTLLMVRQDALTMYGFATDDERSMFEQLNTITGVGPRVALNILGSLGASGVAAAVHTRDAPALQRVPGIGPRTAARVFMALAGRVDAHLAEDYAPSASAAVEPSVRREVIAALGALGWKSKVADDAVDAALAARPADSPPDVSALLKRALAQLGSRR